MKAKLAKQNLSETSKDHQKMVQTLNPRNLKEIPQNPRQILTIFSTMSKNPILNLVLHMERCTP